MVKYILILVFLLILYLGYQLRFVKIKHLEIPSSKISKDYTILHMTDLHVNPFLDYPKIQRAIEKYQPDILCFTGDLIHNKAQDLNKIGQKLSFLKEYPFPKFFIYGNHDLWSKKEVRSFLESYGFQVLEDQLYPYNEEISVLGYSHSTRLHDFLTKDETFTLSLLHDPMNFIQSHKTSDLILCGHTHGGQVRFPFIGALYIPNQEYFPKYEKGLYYTVHGPIHISSGLGYSELPLRFLNPPEITFIHLKQKNAL